jgi:hypothetical protein
MKFSTSVIAKLFGAFALASLAAANTVDMVSQDSVDRTIIFTPQIGSSEIPSVELKGGETKTVSFPQGWIGNWYTVAAGEANVPGMLGEVRWDGFGGNHFFDVSAIVQPDDHHNVKIMYPKNAKTPTSGCQTFPCANAYNLPDDIQTKSTTESELVCLIGDLSPTQRRHPRDVFSNKDYTF